MDGKPDKPVKSPGKLSRLETVIEVALMIDGLAGIAYLALVLPPFIVRETLSPSESYWIYFGYPTVSAAIWSAFSAFYASIAIFWFVALYDPKEKGRIYQISMLVLAIFANFWLGFGIWLLAVKLLHISGAASDPGTFGRMVWWNLVDSVPVLDIDSVLDWERPMEEYNSSIAWMLLIQRIVLLLTLARSIQVVLSSTLSSNEPSLEAAQRRQHRRESRRARRNRSARMSTV